MCGLFGIVSSTTPINVELANTCLELLKHRGPDQQGTWENSMAYLGHRRLSIVDLSSNGRQPMSDKNDSVIITVNGEIYNYKELYNELKDKHCFKSNSDSEVILHGFREWGITQLLSKLEGMYAFSIYDVLNNKLYLARDRIGIKPLYYSIHCSQLIWASELKSIERYLHNSLIIDATAMYDFLTYRYIPSPKTMYKYVYKLEPATFIEYDLNTNNLTKQHYWELNLIINNSRKNIVSEIQDELSLSLRQHLIGDVPVNFFLSGGIDSSLLTALACRNSGKVNTYSIGINSKKFDESIYSTQVANHISSNHYSKSFNITDSNILSDKMRDWYDEPFADFSALPTYLVCQFLKENGGKVAISGDGGDEVFGGYSRYFHQHIHRPPGNIQRKSFTFIKTLCDMSPYYSRLWRLGRLIARTGIYSGLELYADLIDSLPRDKKQLYKNHLEIDTDYDEYWFFRKYYRKELPVLTRFQYMDIHTYLPEDILTKVDRVSMATSIEVRVPYLSHKLVESVFSIPETYRNPNARPKELLAQIAAPYLPKEIIKRPKKGFGIPKEFRKDESSGSFLYPQEKILKDHFSSEINLT